MEDDRDQEVQRVLEAIDALGDSEDPTVRAKRLTELLKQWPDTYAKVREMRQRAVTELHKGGMTYRQIGELLSMSHGRVGQIIAGETASYMNRPKPKKGPPQE